MKLKQRVIVTGSLFLVMSTLFIIGTHLGWRAEDAVNSQSRGKAIPRGSQRKIETAEEGPQGPEALTARGIGAHPRADKGLNRPPELPRAPGARPPKSRPEPGLPGNSDTMLRSREDLLQVLRNRTARLGNGMQGPESFQLPQEMDRELLARLGELHLDRNRPPVPEGQDRTPNAVNQLANEIRRRNPPEFRRKSLREGIPGPDPEVPSDDTAIDKLNKVPNEVPEDVSKSNPWDIWRRWVRQDRLYPEDVFWSDQMNHIINSMATAEITSFDVGYKGTQLKAGALLGKQKAVFKPMRYPRNEVIEGDPYAGFDRHNGEIAGFHLDGILGFNMAAPVAGRKVNLTALKPVTSQKLLSTYFEKGDSTCFYGKCYYCKPEEAACADGEIMEGSVTLWLPDWYGLKTWRHPWQRTYRHGVKAKWEKDDNYCQSYLNPSSPYYHGLLEITDASVFDFFMGNADRHHYETYAKAPEHGKMMHIDNGKTFGNPYHDEISILTPLVQCCRLRNSTWSKLRSLHEHGPLSEILDRSLKRDPVYPILTREHLTAVDRRLPIIIRSVEQCIQDHSRDTVIVSSWG